MKPSTKTVSSVSALIWGASNLLVCLLTWQCLNTRSGVLDGFSSIYPGFHGARTLADALLGTGYRIVDGAELADSFSPGRTTGSRTCRQQRRFCGFFVSVVNAVRSVHIAPRGDPMYRSCIGWAWLYLSR